MSTDTNQTTAPTNAVTVAASAKKEEHVLCFIVDTTGSMGSWITAVQAILSEITDMSMMTRAFDAISIIEYGDYDSSWVTATINKSLIGGIPKEKIPVRFSGWAPLTRAGRNGPLVTDPTARVDVQAIHTFAKGMQARGGGGCPEAFKSGMLAFGKICQTTLSTAAKVHAVLLTDAPMHFKDELDSEGKQEFEALSANPFGLNSGGIFSCPEIYQYVLDALRAPDAEIEAYNAYKKAAAEEANAPPLPPSTTLSIADKMRSLFFGASGAKKRVPNPPPSRLHFSAICSNASYLGTYALLTHLTGGSAINARSVQKKDLRDTIQGLLNAWMGIKPAAPAPDAPSPQHAVGQLQLKGELAANEAGDSLVEVSLGTLSDSDVCDRCNFVQNNTAIPVQPGLRAAFRRCLALVLPSAAEVERAANEKKKKKSAKKLSEKAAAALKRQQEDPAAIEAARRLARVQAYREAYIAEISPVLRSICSSAPMALCASPPLGKIWRAFTKRRDDPIRAELLALLDGSKRALSPDELEQFNAWNTSSYDASAEIKKELRTFVASEGVKGLVVFEGGAEADVKFDPRTLNNAFITCDPESQASIMAILARLRVDETFSIEPQRKPVEEEEEDSSEDDDEAAGEPTANAHVDPMADVGTNQGGATAPDTAAPGDEDIDALLGISAEGALDVEEADIGDDDDDSTNKKEPLPFPDNALPLNLPRATLFRLLASTAVKGMQLSRRPAAIVAALALRSGSVVSGPAAQYLAEVRGDWINYQMLEDAEGEAAASEKKDKEEGGDAKAEEKGEEGAAAPPQYKDPPAAKTPMISENFVGAFIRTMLWADYTLKHKREREEEEEEDEGGKEAVTKTAAVLTDAERDTMNQLLKVSQLTRTDNWEVTVKILDVSSTDGDFVDYTVECAVCRKDRSYSLIADDGVCGYCKKGRTPAARKTLPDAAPSAFTLARIEAAVAEAKKKKVEGEAEAVDGDDQTLRAEVDVSPEAAREEATFQVRCNTCLGYYVRDRAANVWGGVHRCHYCREANKARADSNNNNNNSDNNNNNNKAEKDDAKATARRFPHVHECVSCRVGIVGAPSRPLPNGGLCAGCAKGAARRAPLTCDKPMRLAKLFPYALYWRDVASGVGLDTVPEWALDLVGPAAAPPQSSLALAAQAFVMPAFAKGGNKNYVTPTDPSVSGIALKEPITDLPPDRFLERYLRLLRQQGAAAAAAAVEEADGDDEKKEKDGEKDTKNRKEAAASAGPPNTYRLMANIDKVWANLLRSVFSKKFGGDTIICSLCCEEFRDPTKVQPACGRSRCDQRVCRACGEGWYGGNAIGKVIIPRKLLCPCCARIPTAKALRLTNVDALICHLPKEVQRLDTRKYHIAWCRGCSKPKEYAEKSCVGAQPEGVEGFMCEACEVEAMAAKSRKNNELNCPQCPSCKAPTIRNGGCAHITCLCGTHWCYDCGEGFDAAEKCYDHMRGSCAGRAEVLVGYSDGWETD